MKHLSNFYPGSTLPYLQPAEHLESQNLSIHTKGIGPEWLKASVSNPGKKFLCFLWDKSHHHLVVFWTCSFRSSSSCTTRRLDLVLSLFCLRPTGNYSYCSFCSCTSLSPTQLPSPPPVPLKSSTNRRRGKEVSQQPFKDKSQLPM